MSPPSWTSRISLLGCVFSILTFGSVGGRSRSNVSTWERQDVSYRLSSLATGSLTNEKDECPPCFNCQLPAFTCGQFGECNKYDGQCKCPPGWGGIDCLIPQCDSLADGERRRLREFNRKCECKDGWGGINCNVCQNDDACIGFPIPELEAQYDDDDEPHNMTCYKGGQTVFSNHQMCDVTNRAIIDILEGKKPQVTFSCNTAEKSCSFQFWVAEVESFYCGLEGCSTQVISDAKSNKTLYACEKMKCDCVPGRFICGSDDSIDIHEFLQDSIKGPAKFTCSSGLTGCKFEEDAMNELIDSVFGDPYITLSCNGGECLHYSQVPGYIIPEKPDSTRWVALSTAGAIFVVITASAALWYAGRDRTHGHIRLPENEAAKLMTDHVPATLHFSNVSYAIGSRIILDSISGSIKPGQVMAIMGASGAGKSTFLDIIARRRKKGIVTGKTLVNGRHVSDSDFMRVVGFVDQEDTLMSTLTVYETILYSALLRLPRDMSLEAKKFRTLETMQELGILGIKDSRIGDSGHRSISGGEKRRVSIACELVTSPSILFLDEPTSGLDAYNAFNVVDSLVSLARNYNRTVIFTIHQPRSNIVALFDQLVLLAQGKLVYSGEMSRCQQYFENIGQSCPPGFNIADYLIDLTTRAVIEPSTEDTTPIDSGSGSQEDDTNLADEEQGLIPHHHNRAARSLHSSTDTNEETEMQTRATSVNTEFSGSGFIKRKASQLMGALTNGSAQPEAPVTPRLAVLVEAYATSESASSIRAEIDSMENRAGDLPDVIAEDSLLKGRKGASWATQFRILSGRAFKNLYRDPMLLTMHYCSSIALALICGFFFHDVKNDIPGFQNRLGVFFFTLALFGFSCLSSLGLFANERILFMRERANGYYSSFTYFSSKILFDILPLRIVPPLVFGAIIYRLVGLVPEVVIFWKFMLILVMFNLTTASVILFISIAFESTSVANLVGTLTMLFNLLFTGLLINRDTLGRWSWLNTISFFHAAFEALAVNELRYLQLTEHKFGVDLDVPAATILSTFGLKSQSFWWPNTALLGIFFGSTTVLSWVVLHFYVREKR